ncbi:Uncharacterised protein [uncultured archaeon]|nr:Uncharacterised protein [uncultured archaeon]
MGLLNRLFKSQESVAKDLGLKDEEFVKIWQDYHKTFSEKESLISAISADNYQNFVSRLQKLLTLELSDAEQEEKSERELVDSLESVEHDERIRKVQRLYDRLAYAESRYKYIFRLLEELHNLLLNQVHIVEKLSSAKDAGKLISHLKSQLAVEQEVLKQIESRETFHELFLALVKGEQIIGRMDSKEKQLLKRMTLILNEDFRIKSVPGPWRKKGITYEWANKVYEGLKAQVNGYIEHYEEDEAGSNPNVDFEFVNHPDFVVFVKQCAAELGQNPSEQMVNVFVHVFRELYNNKND